MSKRPDGRDRKELRKIKFEMDYVKWAEGSVLVCFGDTKVIVNATWEDRVPNWMKDKGTGWISAEYAMLPRATDQRNQRESVKGKIGGRTHEISRLIGRSLRAAVDLDALGEKTITLDCDVIQADGGTRTAAITGAYLALRRAVHRAKKNGKLKKEAMLGHVAAVSVGIVGGEVCLDLMAAEDQSADTDLNLVMREDGGIVEIQGTAEGVPFSAPQLAEMLELGRQGIRELFVLQEEVIQSWS